MKLVRTGLPHEDIQRGFGQLNADLCYQMDTHDQTVYTVYFFICRSCVEPPQLLPLSSLQLTVKTRIVHLHFVLVTFSVGCILKVITKLELWIEVFFIFSQEELCKFEFPSFQGLAVTYNAFLQVPFIFVVADQTKPY